MIAGWADSGSGLNHPCRSGNERFPSGRNRINMLVTKVEDVVDVLAGLKDGNNLEATLDQNRAVELEARSSVVVIGSGGTATAGQTALLL